MTRSRLGKSKRLAAFLCVLLLALETVSFPLTQAKAAATAALATVGFGVTTAAFLAACGIYPYWVDDSSAVNFDWEEWVDDDLTALVNEYNAANSATPINPNQISAFLSGATLLLGNYAWEKLCDFVEWIKTKYAVADNQEGVRLGVSKGESIPVFPSAPSYADLIASGLFLGVSTSYVPAGKSIYAGSVGASEVYAYKEVQSSQSVLRFISSSSSQAYFSTFTSSADVVDISVSTPFAFGSGQTWYYSSFTIALSTFSPELHSFPSIQTAATYFSGDSAVFSGVTADTTTVSIPDALPQGTEYGGLRVSGLPAATTAESVTDAVQDSVGERLKTPVEVVEVELAPGTEVDSETGAITQNPVVIEAPVVETIPAVSELIAPDSFVGTAVNALQTKFPFCLPFDVMRIAQAFIVPPSAPVITLTFHEPFTDADYTISVDLSPWDNVAAVVRFLWSLVLFVGFSLRIASLFHVDRSTGELFLGNVGSPGV